MDRGSCVSAIDDRAGALFEGAQSPSATSSKKSPVAVSEQAQIEQDNELLTAVNSEITEGVPAPMQPLEVSFSNSSASSANQTK